MLHSFDILDAALKQSELYMKDKETEVLDEEDVDVEEEMALAYLSLDEERRQ